jgi:hypothetical protein
MKGQRRRQTDDRRRQRKLTRVRRWPVVGRLPRKCRHSGDQRETGIRRCGVAGWMTAIAEGGV